MTAETSVTKMCSKELHHFSLFPVLCTKEYNSRVFISIHLSPNLDRTTTACELKRTSYVSFLLLVSTVTRRVIILVSTTASSAPGQTSGCLLCFGLDESHSASCQRYIFFKTHILQIQAGRVFTESELEKTNQACCHSTGLS